MLSRLGNFTIQYQSAGASSIWKLSNDGRNFVTPNPKLGTQPIQFQMDITTGSFNFSGSYGMLYAPAFQKHVYNDGFSDVSLTEWYLKTINGDVSTSGGYGFIFFANKDGTFQNFSTSTSFTSASPFSEFVDYGIPLIQGVTITSSILFPDPYGYAGSWSINPSLPLYLISASSTSSSTTGQGGVLQCLSANGSSSLLSPLILANCSSDALIQQQQLFSIRFVQGSAIKITNSSLSLCLDLLKDPTSNVTVAIQNTCQLSLQSQKWVLNFQDMSLRSNMNVSMCLTSPILNQSMQMQITLQPCIVNGDPTQQWVPSLTGEL